MKNFLASASVITLCMTSASFASAQEVSGLQASEETRSEEITGTSDILVVARKRSERLIDVPETITAISSDGIKQAGISSLSDLGRQTPGLLLAKRGDNEPNVVIRGVGAFGNTQGIGFYIDDVQNFTDQSAAIEDVERIEILKGPQGTLYGGSSVGGAIKYIMKRPGDVFAVEGKAEYGSFDTMNLFAAVNVPLVADGVLGARVSGYLNRTDGIIENLFRPGERVDRSREFGVRLALDWRPSDVLNVQFSYRHNDLDNGYANYSTADSLRDFSRSLLIDGIDKGDRTVDGGILQIENDLGAVTLTSISSYTRRSNNWILDIDYSELDLAVAQNGDRNTTHVLTQELRLASDAGGPFDWIIGGYFSRTKNRNTTNHADVILGIDNPANPTGAPIFIDGFNNANAIDRQYAAFATANYEFGALRIGGGIRLNRTEFVADLLNDNRRESVKDTRLLPKLSLAYKFSPDVMLYANVARGMEPGKVNLGTGTGTAFDPEKATNFEIGFKGQTDDRRFMFDIAGFYIQYKDRQFETRRLIDSVLTEQIFNIGDSKSYGIEAGLNYRPVPELMISATGGYLHSEWTNGEFDLQPTKGLQVPYAPKVSANASVDWRQPVGNVELGLRAEVSHRGALYWDVLNLVKDRSIELVNLRASLGSPQDGWEFSLRVDNLFDVGYFEDVQYLNGVPAGGTCNRCSINAPGMPRRVMGAVRFSF